MALVLSRPLFWILVVLVMIVLFNLARKVHLRWIPALFLRAALLIALISELFSIQQQSLVAAPLPLEVLIVDQSDSIDPQQLKRFEEEALQWKKSAPNRLLLAVGEEAYFVGNAFRSDNGRATNLERALDLAVESLVKKNGRIILASDGISSNPLAFSKRLIELKQAQIPLVVIPLEPRQTKYDVYLGRLIVPPTLWANSTFLAYQELVMPEKGTVEFELRANEQPFSSQSLELEPGTHWIELPLEAKEAGILTLETRVTYPGDEWQGNNQVFGVVQIYETPKVLMLTQTPEEVQEFARNLQSAGVSIDVKSPSELSDEDSTFQSYKVVILHNLLATSLSGQQMAALRNRVVDQGQGLILTGGLNSLTLGGYLDTPLEMILPVRLEPPPRNARSPLAFVIMLDSSGSMSVKREGKPEPILLASEAAARTIESLRAEDYFGLAAFSTSAQWKVPIRILGDGLDKRSAMDAVTNVNAYGGTKLLLSMQECFRAMQEKDPPVNHKNLLILSDGKSSDGKAEDFIALTQEIREAGWTVSVVSFGEDVNGELLTAIAKAGNGRYHHVRDASELPRVMIAESKAASGENIQEGTTSLVPGDSGHPLLGGFSSNEFPPIETYNALTSRKEEGSEDILISSNFGDPILSAWQVGLGRVIVWATDIGNQWAPEWDRWDKAAQFWVRIIRYALPDPSFGLDRSSVQVNPGHVLVKASLAEVGESPPSQYPVEYVVTKENTVYSYPMLPIEPEVYQTQLNITELGAYRGVVQYHRDHQRYAIPAPFVINYPSEWKPADKDQGRENLSQWVSLSGGEIRSGLPDASVIQSQTTQESKRTVRWSKIVMLLLIFWPIEIALRRRWLPWH